MMAISLHQETDTSDAGCTWHPHVFRGWPTLRSGAAGASSCCQVALTSVGGCLRWRAPSLRDGFGAHLGTVPALETHSHLRTEI